MPRIHCVHTASQDKQQRYCNSNNIGIALHTLSRWSVLAAVFKAVTAKAVTAKDQSRNANPITPYTAQGVHLFASPFCLRSNNTLHPSND